MACSTLQEVEGLPKAAWFLLYFKFVTWIEESMFKYGSWCKSWNLKGIRDQSSFLAHFFLCTGTSPFFPSLFPQLQSCSEMTLCASVCLLILASFVLKSIVLHLRSALLNGVLAKKEKKTFQHLRKMNCVKKLVVKCIFYSKTVHTGVLKLKSCVVVSPWLFV